MATAARDTSDEGQICGLFDGWLTALRAKDVNGRTAGYAADVVVFDVINPMQHVGLDGLRQRLEKWFSTFTSPIDCEMRDLSIAAGNDVAWCHFLNRFSGSTRAGGALDMWVRFTVCLRKIDGHWMVTHEHASVPFDVETGRASVDLAP